MFGDRIKCANHFNVTDSSSARSGLPQDRLDICSPAFYTSTEEYACPASARKLKSIGTNECLLSTVVWKEHEHWYDSL
ncbi:hypothetical protein ZHAS_00013842 [Anopheles sinensis]|uniref:Uncharacterized protein n=1 Tax=Anopheles sinensis TaxID=74873 RepID=A0A084W6M3_ANOSI|nr:hypothetical protein ZHAS_00013842 [Anopheles sinensis]